MNKYKVCPVCNSHSITSCRYCCNCGYSFLGEQYNMVQVKESNYNPQKTKRYILFALVFSFMGAVGFSQCGDECASGLSGCSDDCGSACSCS